MWLDLLFLVLIQCSYDLLQHFTVFCILAEQWLVPGNRPSLEDLLPAGQLGTSAVDLVTSEAASVQGSDGRIFQIMGILQLRITPSFFHFSISFVSFYVQEEVVGLSGRGILRSKLGSDHIEHRGNLSKGEEGIERGKIS